MTDPSIVITGLSLRLPGASTQDEFWDLLIDGIDRTRPVSEERRRLTRTPDWHDTIGEVEGIDLFDAEFFGIDDEEARFMDPQHRMVMELAYDAVCDAGLLEAGRNDARRYSVFSALCTNSYFPKVCRYMEDNGIGDLHPRTIMNSMNSALAARLSHQYNLTGPVMSVDTACSSFLTALSQAADSIRHQDCEGSVVAGANLLSAAYSSLLCDCGGITTAHSHTRVFDEEADGTLLGEGAVVCVLEREDIARQRNRKIYGRILADAINNDGSSLNIMAPNPRGQAEVIRDSYSSGVDHTRIRYVETHGTGTRIGDPIEVNALSQVYRQEDFGDVKVGLGAVKSNIGHLLAAAGGAGLAKLLLSLERGQMAPSLHMETINPLLEIEKTPFDVVTEARPWPRVDDQPRVGAVTSLGLGGTNVHFVIEEGDGERTGTHLPEPLLCFSAKTPEALRRMIDDLGDYLKTRSVDPYNLAMTLARFRPGYGWRATARIDSAATRLSGLRFSAEEKTVRRVLLRPGPEASAHEEILRDMLSCKVRVSEETPKSNQLAVSCNDTAPTDGTVVIDPRWTRHDIAAELFLHGAPVDWEPFFPNGTGTILSLTPYPFARRQHWLTN
ncbi:beta-ketoacyl synthase N-terminal-like domain-containing protein [Haloglycomyces albus]|uniref:beta-ketoacyl synthase N-terminal-like domain-containing protein n=1 Tax=Haloglycomyces albus TaxID=526067 RepID=UPI0004B00380|nr:polyketide synthase [Haloglycomyces albus]